MKTTPELIDLIDQARDYIVVRACCGLAPDPQVPVMKNLMLALAELPPADRAAEERMRTWIRGRAARRARLRVVAGTDVRDAYEQTDSTGWVTTQGETP